MIYDDDAPLRRNNDPHDDNEYQSQWRRTSANVNNGTTERKIASEQPNEQPLHT